MNQERIWYLFARKLAGEASREELKELDVLEKEDPGFFLELQVIDELWNKNPCQDHEYLEATYYLHYEKMKKMGMEPVTRLNEEDNSAVLQYPGKNFTGRKKIFITAGLMAILTATILSISLFSGRSGQAAVTGVAGVPAANSKEVVTKKGTNSHFTLPDGSGVWLNAGSSLNYEKVSGEGLREVYLNGEAFFDVVKNPKRPFIIHTSAIDIKVLGTSFNVKAYPDDHVIETSLIHGSVEVTVVNKPGEKYLLKPNQKLILPVDYGLPLAKKQQFPPNVKAGRSLASPVVTIQKLSYIEGDTTAAETAWKSNKFSFYEEPLIELSKKMERWYDVVFEFRNKQIENELMTGSFERVGLQSAMEALQFTNNNKFRYRIEQNRIVIF